MTTYVRVVIVGGGILGCSVAYHLSHEGWSDLVLLEKSELTSGSTWHAAGQVTHSTSSYTLGRIAGYAIKMFKKLEIETQQSVSFHNCGSLRIVYEDDEVDWLHYTLSVGTALGHSMEILTPNKIREKHPFYVLDGVKAALWTPEDGHVDPSGITFALAAGARQLGAKIIRGTRVTNICREPNGEWRVITNEGDFVCEHVVNAGGNYARQIGQWTGLNLPITCMTHHYFVTDTVPEFLKLDHELPVVRDNAEVSGYIRMEQKSGLVGIYEKENPKAVWLDGAPWEAENELFEPDYDRIMPWLSKAFERVPVLAECGIKREIHGAITHTPDGNMLLGPAPGIPNYWCCCGSPNGIGWGPGAGKFTAQWIVHGAAEISMRQFDPRRFGDFVDESYAVSKACEDYTLALSTPYPHFNRLIGRPVKKSPLYDTLRQAGAVHEQDFGWESPAWFAQNGMPQEDCYSFRRPKWHDLILEEVKAVRERVGIMDVSAFGKIDVHGPGAKTFVSRVIANRVPKRRGAIVLSHLLNERGTIECETTVARIDDYRFYFIFAASFELRVRDWLKGHIKPGEDVRVDVVSNEICAISLQGPRSRETLAAVTEAQIDNVGFPWLTTQRISVAGINLRALRLSYVGELGWELHARNEDALAVFEALWAAGETYGIAHFGSFAANAMRMEKMFKSSAELTNDVTLPEADVMRFVSFDKPEGFIGDIATSRSAKCQDRQWQCVYLDIKAKDADCVGGEAILYDGRSIGAVSSGAWGPTVGASLAFGYVPPDYAAPGTQLQVMVLGKLRSAIVRGEAMYDPDNRRPRA